jgi:hypothetical protein
MNPYFYKWQRVEHDSGNFVLRSSRPIGRWLGYWFNLTSEVLWIGFLGFFFGMLVFIPFSKMLGETSGLLAVFGISFLALLTGSFLNARSDPYVTLELRFFCDQQKIELLGRSALGFLVVRQFELNKSVQITGHCSKLDDGSVSLVEIHIAFDPNTDVVLGGLLSLTELEYHMDFFLKVLPQHITKEIQQT